MSLIVFCVNLSHQRKRRVYTSFLPVLVKHLKMYDETILVRVLVTLQKCHFYY